jgi:hypothetical protein
VLEKKVITLAGAAGILACGACFLPPLPGHVPAPPPVRLDLQGIHRIHVVAVNASPTHHLNADRLASLIADSARSEGRGDRLTAFSGPIAPGPSTPDRDGELKVIVLNESANPGQKGYKKGTVGWIFEVSVSAELRNSAGVTVWRENSGHYLTEHDEKPGDAAAAWADNDLHDWLALVVGNRVVFRMLNDFE